MSLEGYDPDPDPERVACLRGIAEEFQGRGFEAEMVGAILYRVSDLYDPDGETSPRDVYVNMRNVLITGERGTDPTEQFSGDLPEDVDDG